MLKWVEIDLAAVDANIRWTLRRLDQGVRLMAVVKADGYGHGAAQVARRAAARGAAALGVLTVEEGRSLRQTGIRLPTHLLAPVLPEQASAAVKLKLVPTVDTLKAASAFDACAPKGFPVHLDLDFGLGRWGIPPRELRGFLAGMARLRKLKLAGLSAHIDYVAGKNAVEAEEKLRAFGAIARDLKRRFPGVVCHAANSSVVMDFPQWQLDMVRVGNLLYGIDPSARKTAPLKNPWRFHARIIALRPIAKGSSIGYASEYVAPRRMLVATVPVGYSDGLTMVPEKRDISLGSGYQYWGMLRGRKAPFIGRAAIAHTLLDASGCPGARLGDEVLLPVRRTAASHHLPRIYS
ncbi:MAG: alanine racemase [Elusimicrobia bacterium]|nr:alanine racemase [Elusimicrobiota bacterium]